SIALGEFTGGPPVQRAGGDPADSEPISMQADRPSIAADSPDPETSSGRLGAGIGALAGAAAASEASSPPAPPKPGDAFIVDRMVGQVNGRPIFAHEFFAPIDDQLRARSQELTPRQFETEAASIIARRLRDVVLNQLLLAEAEAELNEQQRQGLFAFLRDLEENIILEKGGGTRSGLRQQLKDEEGITINEAIASRREELLISNVYRQRVLPRVIVSWRDVQNEYERRFAEFNPPAKLVVSRIRLGTATQADEIAAVSQRLAAGESFKAVASDVGMPDGGSWQTFLMGPDGVQDVESDVLTSALEGLTIGSWSGPFELGRATWWVYLDDIEQPRGKSLYDPELQRSLASELFGERQREEETRYFRKLFERGIVDDLDAMADRLID
ncbi:MAG: hypothetical protein KC983_04275, partial [Phycisphaerales bacterium]|nr:hypothetical protein [Phycisphaerales bacterium]